MSAQGYVEALRPILVAAVRGGHDLGDVLSAALQETAVEVGSVEALATRPDSWEAQHVQELAEPARDIISARVAAGEILAGGVVEPLAATEPPGPVQAAFEQERADQFAYAAAIAAIDAEEQREHAEWLAAPEGDRDDWTAHEWYCAGLATAGDVVNMLVNGGVAGDMPVQRHSYVVTPEAAERLREGAVQACDTTQTAETAGRDGLYKRLSVAWTFGQLVCSVTGDPTEYDSLSDASVDLVADLAEFLSSVVEGLAYRDQCAALAADGHAVPPAPPSVATGGRLEAILRIARTAAGSYRAAERGV